MHGKYLFSLCICGMCIFHETSYLASTSVDNAKLFSNISTFHLLAFAVKRTKYDLLLEVDR